ncbi:MAG: hypothetical protein AB7G11_11915 [Phycisphaerales bacterium]
MIMWLVVGWVFGIGNEPAARGGAGPDAEARAQIEDVLRSMSAAVNAGDKDAYLRHVWLDNTYFATEQRHWADELAAHRPLRFELGIAPIDDALTKRTGAAKWGQEVFGAERAEFALRMTYRADVGHAAEEAGAVATWPAAFVKADPDGDGPLPAQWLYAGENWRELWGNWMTPEQQRQARAPAAGHDAASDARGLKPGAPPPGAFVVKFFPGFETVAQMVVEAFPPAKRHVDEGFEIDYQPASPIEIKLFDDMEHLKASVYLNMPDDWLGGWNEPGESIKFMTYYTNSVPRWTGAFAHEYGHTATWQMGPRLRESPWWLHEGVAELAAEYFTQDAGRIESMMRQRARRGPGAGKRGLLPWDSLADYQKADADVKQMAYWQGHHFVGWVSDQWGREGRNKWLRAIGAGSTLDRASRDVLGESFEALDKRWRAELGEGAAK